MLDSHVAEAEELLPTPFTALAAQLPIHVQLPVDSEPTRATLSQKAHALCHAELYVHKGDVFDVHMRATVKSGGVFLKLSNGRGWVAEQTPLGEKVVAEAKLIPCTDIFRVLSDSLRIRKSASRNDVALSTRVTKVDNVSGMRALDLSYSDVFEAAGAVYVRGDKYIRLKDGRGYVLALDGGTPLVMRVQPQVGVWMYKVTYPGGIGLRHIASMDDQHRVAEPSEREHPANIPQGTAVECNMRVLKRIGGSIVAFARLSDGSGWMFSQKGGKSLAELIAYDYSSGPTDEDAAAEVGGTDAKPHDAVPVPQEEVDAREAAVRLPEPELKTAPSRAALSPVAHRTALGSNGNAANMLSPATNEREAMEKAKVASANMHAAATYASIDDNDEMGVVDAVSSLARIWPSAA